MADQIQSSDGNVYESHTHALVRLPEPGVSSRTWANTQPTVDAMKAPTEFLRPPGTVMPVGDIISTGLNLMGARAGFKNPNAIDPSNSRAFMDYTNQTRTTLENLRTLPERFHFTPEQIETPSLSTPSRLSDGLEEALSNLYRSLDNYGFSSQPRSPRGWESVSTGTNPSVAKEKLGNSFTLERTKEPTSREHPSFGKETYETLQLNNEKGNLAATGSVVIRNEGKEAHVGGFYSTTNQTMTLGPKAIINTARQLKSMYPELETITAMRVSGARHGQASAGGSSRMRMNIKSLKPSEEPVN